MSVWMVERDLQGISMEALAAAQGAAIAAAGKATAQGTPVRYLRSVFSPQDGRCCCLFEAASAEAVPIGALPGGPHEIARLLFHEFLLPFEITSVLILIAIMGAVVLASRPEAVAKRPPDETAKAPLELVGAGKER